MKPRTLCRDLCFGEGPRWHEGHLYLSDMHDHKVVVVDDFGRKEVLVEVPARPSGLGWLPNGDLLIVSMVDRRLLRFDGRQLTLHADLSALARFHCNDLVVAATGRAYVGHFGFDLHANEAFRTAELILVEIDGTARIAAREMAFPNGSVITPDGRTLIVAESFAGRLSAFDIGTQGDLAGRRVFAQLPQGVVPDGICLDEASGVWVASPTSSECFRVEEGGAITHRVGLDQGAFACMLGGATGKTLYIVSAPGSHPEQCRTTRRGRIDVVDAPYRHAGLP